jgi:hypothetical protein
MAVFRPLKLDGDQVAADTKTQGGVGSQVAGQRTSSPLSAPPGARSSDGRPAVQCVEPVDERDRGVPHSFFATALSVTEPGLFRTANSR